MEGSRSEGGEDEEDDGQDAQIVAVIQRIGEVASALVPFMCMLYIACGLVIVALHAAALPAAIATIVRAAFTGEAGTGGMVGVLMQGFRRAAFSNEAGCGSSPIVHSAARTEELAVPWLEQEDAAALAARLAQAIEKTRFAW